MRKPLMICCSFAALIATGQVQAADLPPQPEPPPLVAPPPPPVIAEVEDRSCIYARVDAGYAIHGRPKVSKNSGGGYANANGERLDDNYVVDLGIGCTFNDYLRGDVTVGYRSTTDLDASVSNLSAKVQSYTAMVNAYVDIGHFGAVTPYVGIGVGVAHNKLNKITLPAGQQSGQDTNFAWALHAGASIQLTKSMAIDASYRYIDLGSVTADTAVDPLQVKKLTAHDIRIGLRVNFAD